MAEEEPKSTWDLLLTFAQQMVGAPTHPSFVNSSPVPGTAWDPRNNQIPAVPAKDWRTGKPLKYSPTFGHIPLWEWLWRGGGTGQADRESLEDIHGLWKGSLWRETWEPPAIWAPKLAGLGIFIEEPPRRDAPTEPPKVTQKTALGLFVDSYQQSGWWWKARRDPSIPHMQAHSRQQEQGWVEVRKQSEPIARPQLTAAVGYIETHAGAPFTGVPASTRRLVGTWL